MSCWAGLFRDKGKYKQALEKQVKTYAENLEDIVKVRVMDTSGNIREESVSSGKAVMINKGDTILPIKKDNVNNPHHYNHKGVECIAAIENDVVNKPLHYNHKSMECIELMEEMSSLEEFRGHLRLTAFKYLHRHPYKGKPVQDLDKCIWYIKRLKDTWENKDATDNKTA